MCIGYTRKRKGRNKMVSNQTIGKKDFKRTVDEYNSICISLPRVTKVSSARKKAMAGILSKYTAEELKVAFMKAQSSRFLRGEIRGKGHENWRCTFDWIMKDANLAKILDGNYDDCNNYSTKNQKETKSDMQNTEMNMKYEYITPEIATQMLDKNTNNRSVKWNVVQKYANDIRRGNWHSSVASAIAIDKDGILRDGQHRLWAILEAEQGIWTWVCRNVASDGLYDSNIVRSPGDQMEILDPDLERVYKSKKYIAIARWLINRKGGMKRPVSADEIIDFTRQHKTDLDGYFLKINFSDRAGRVSASPIHAALFCAYMNGVSIDKIVDFYEILGTGMSSCPEEFPIVAYRNYLTSRITKGGTMDTESILRCQYALDRYISGAKTKRLFLPKDYIYPIPWTND